MGDAWSAPRSQAGFFALIPGTDSSIEGNLASIGGDVDILRIDFRIALQRLSRFPLLKSFGVAAARS